MSAVRTRLLTGLLGATTLVAAVLAAGPTADATASWASESSATIKPGVQMVTAGAQCTANFVFKDGLGRVYVGYAAHCAGTGSSSDTNGCTTKSLPLGTKVEFVTGGNLLSGGTTVGTGKLAYSSWRTMQRRGTKDPGRCAYNDLALVRVDPASVRKVNPTVPVWGGPSAISTTTLTAGAAIYTVGNSGLRTGTAAAKTGTVTSVAGGGLAYNISTSNPGIPGDSGSGFMDAKGHPVGVLSTLSIGLSLTPVSNTMGNIVRELSYAKLYGGISGLYLAKGTRAFSSNH
ncbi:MAG: trypsin-like peptidase domain-containing protein [Marmoricola sp.]